MQRCPGIPLLRTQIDDQRNDRQKPVCFPETGNIFSARERSDSICLSFRIFILCSYVFFSSVFFTPYSVPPVGRKGIRGSRYSHCVQLVVYRQPELLLEVGLRFCGSSPQRTWNAHPEVVLEVQSSPSRASSKSSQMALPEPLLDSPAGRPPEAPRGLGKISTEFGLEDRRPLSR